MPAAARFPRWWQQVPFFDPALPLLCQLPAHVDVALIFNPQLTVPELLQSLCAEPNLRVYRISGCLFVTSKGSRERILDSLVASA